MYAFASRADEAVVNMNLCLLLMERSRVASTRKILRARLPAGQKQGRLPNGGNCSEWAWCSQDAVQQIRIAAAINFL